jgi:hypothetical protein
VASIAVGMIVSAIRWALFDTLNRYTGLPLPPFNFAKLGQNVEAFRLLISIHYEHYQFYANMFIATALAFFTYKVKQGSHFSVGWLDLGFLLLEAIFFITARDTLQKYYSRGLQLLEGDH